MLLVLAVMMTTMSVIAQDSVVVHFVFQDKRTGDPVPNVSATLQVGNQSAIKSGGYSGELLLPFRRNVRLTATFTHPVYETKRSVIDLNERSDTMRVVIDMVSARMQYVGEVVAKPIGVPYKVFTSERLSVADFEIQRNGKLILLAYPKRLKKGSELLYAEGEKVLNSFQVPGVAHELVRDYRGNTHIVCENSIYGIYVQEDQIGISTLQKDYFFKYILPIVDTNRSKMYFSDYNELYPAFDYFAYDQIDSTYQKIRQIKDDLMMELYRSEYKWVDVRTKLWAKNKEYQTGIDAEIWVGANYFTQSIYYEAPYAPLFHRNDSIFVFDYCKDQLLVHDYQGNPLDSMGIYHHYQPRSTGWKRELIQDNVTGQIYARFEKNGFSYVGLIDTKTGEIGERVRLEYQYVDKIAVHDNFVYYVYRPYESTQKKYVYKERLPYAFTTGDVPENTVSNKP